MAGGQQGTPDEAAADPLADVRQRVAFTNAEDRVIDDWLAARIEQVKAGVGAGGQKAIAASAEFRAAFQSELQNPQSTPRYLDRLADRTAAVAVVEFADADTGPRLVHVTLAWVLLDLNRVSTRDALAAGLRHPQEAVRYLCAKAYAKLRPSISPDAATTRSVIALLKTAGTAETSGVVLRALYEALAYDQARHLTEAVQALTDVFAARVRARQGGQLRRADRAELVAFRHLDRVRHDIAQALRPPLVRQLVALLALDVERHASAIPEERRVVEERIEECESLIEVLAGGGGGDVRGAMKRGGDAMEKEMALELRKWVGGEGVQGALNKAPWNVPVGGLP